MRKALIIGVPLVVLLVAGGAGWWFFIRDDAPPAVAGVAEQFDTPATGAGSSPATSTATTATPSAPTATTADGTWTVRPAANVFAGYRIDEEFAGGAASSTAVGRSPAVTGTLTVDGDQVTAATVEVDMTQLASDSSRRDGQLKSGGLETDRFPAATFTLTAPIELGVDPQVGQVVQATASGDLTLHGVTQSIQLPIEARWTGETVDVTGSAPIVLADYGISMEAFAGFVQVADHGTLELALQFVR